MKISKEVENRSLYLGIRVVFLIGFLLFFLWFSVIIFKGSVYWRLFGLYGELRIGKREVFN